MKPSAALWQKPKISWNLWFDTAVPGMHTCCYFCSPASNRSTSFMKMHHHVLVIPLNPLAHVPHNRPNQPTICGMRLHLTLLIIVWTLPVWPVEGWLEHLQSSTKVYPSLNQENHSKVLSTHDIDNRSYSDISCISIAVSPSFEFEAKQHKCFVPSAL